MMDAFSEPSAWGPSDHLGAGTTLRDGRYRIESFMRAGGFGLTYRARDRRDQVVVIKECFPATFCQRTHSRVSARSITRRSDFERVVKLFIEEASSLARFVHPNIVAVYDVWEENQTAYIAMELVEVCELLDLIKNRDNRLSPARIEYILRRCLTALSYIHDNGVLHRDISPDNILITATGEPVLIDFGGVRRDHDDLRSPAGSGMRVVKDGYSPQEFYVKGAPEGFHSDLYSLASTFYHVISGEKPASSQARLVAIAEGVEDPCRKLLGRFEGYSRGVLESIDAAMRVIARTRIQTAGEWLDRLGRPSGPFDRPEQAASRAIGPESLAARVAGACAAHHQDASLD